MTNNQTPRDRGGSDGAARDGLDALFAEARNAAPEALTADFSARLMADADAAMMAPPPPPGTRWWARLRLALADVGGAPGLAGVGAAGLAGVWIGFSGTGSTSNLLEQFWQGAATVSPAVSEWVEDDPLTSDAVTLLSLISGELE